MLCSELKVPRRGRRSCLSSSARQRVAPRPRRGCARVTVLGCEPHVAVARDPRLGNDSRSALGHGPMVMRCSIRFSLCCGTPRQSARCCDWLCQAKFREVFAPCCTHRLPLTTICDSVRITVTRAGYQRHIPRAEPSLADLATAVMQLRQRQARSAHDRGVCATFGHATVPLGGRSWPCQLAIPPRPSGVRYSE
jgi:hypothetical protein